MPYYKDSNIIFIRVPKTASSSMHKELGSGIGPMHETIGSLMKRLSAEGHCGHEDAFKFGFVRNPWDWLLSWTTYKQDIGWSGWSKFDFNSWIYKIGEIFEHRGGRYWPDSNSEKVSMEFKYIGKDSLSCGISSCRANSGYSCMCLPYSMQSDFLYINGRSGVDFIGRFENIDSDWKFVSSKIKGYDYKKLSLTNKSSNAGYKKVYSDNAAEIVYNIYKKDIDIFKYGF